MDDALLRGAQSDAALQSLADSIRAWNAQQTQELEELLFQQRTRLVGAQRTLATRPTKKAENDARIASNKVEWAKGKLADLRRTAPEARDARIFPGTYASVGQADALSVPPGGQARDLRRQIPGHLQRAPGKSGGLLERNLRPHGVVVASAFYENVSRHRA